MFLTNEFTFPALQVAELYKNKWQVELFLQMTHTASEHIEVMEYLIE